MAIGCPNAAPVANHFAQHFATLVVEAIKTLKFSRTIAFERRQILNWHASACAPFGLWASAVLQHRPEWSTSAINDDDCDFTFERRRVVSATGVREVMRKRQ